MTSHPRYNPHMRATFLGFLILAGGLILAGCSSEDETNLDAFLGIWQLTGTEQTKCGMDQRSKMFSAPVTVTKGSDSPLLVVRDSCTLKFDAKGETATARPNQSCSQAWGMITSTATVAAGSVTLMGINATFMWSGTGQTMLGALAVQCTYTVSGTAMKQQQ